MRCVLALLLLLILGLRCLGQVKDAEYVLAPDAKRICEQDLLRKLDSALSKKCIPAALHSPNAAPNDPVTLVPLETASPRPDLSQKLFTPFQGEFDRGRLLGVFDQVSPKFENNAAGFLGNPSSGNKVFLSYTRADHPVAMTVAELLREEGFDVFTYLTHEGDFVTTASNVGYAFETANYKLLLQSPDSRFSDAVNSEIIATRATPDTATLNAFSSADWQRLSETKFFDLPLPGNLSIRVDDMSSTRSSRYRSNTAFKNLPIKAKLYSPSGSGWLPKFLRWIP